MTGKSNGKVGNGLNPEQSPHQLPRLETASPGSLLLGGIRMAVLDVESGFWALCRQLEALVGRNLTNALLRQAGANGGAALARAVLGGAGAASPASGAGAASGARTAGAAGDLDALRDCLAAYEAAGFGHFEVVSAKWPIGRVLIRGKDTFEAWMLHRHSERAAFPVCAYTSGVLVGFTTAVAGRRDIVCIERRCQAEGSKECLFELLPAGPALQSKAVGVDPDPALSYQLNLLEILFDRMPMGIAVFDRSLVLRRFNPTWADFFGRRVRSRPLRVLPGMSLRELLPESQAELAPLFERVLSGETVRREAVRTEIRGVVAYWDVVLSPLIRGGQAVGFVEVTVDATERVQAYQTLEQRVEERTREIEQRRQVAESLRETLAILNSNLALAKILDHLVKQAARILGVSAVALWRVDPDTQLLGILASCGLPDWYAQNARLQVGEGAVGRAVLTGRPVAYSDTAAAPAVSYAVTDTELNKRLVDLRGEFRALLAVPLQVKDESGALALHHHEPRDFDDEDVEMAVAFAHQASLAIENSRLRSQAAHSAVAAERSRLARDLHDAVTQTLFSASLIAEVLPRIWDKDQVQGRARLGELRQLTRGALAEMRTLLLELRPSALIEAALGDILRHLCEAITGRARVPVKLIVEGQRPLPPEVQVAFYRIAQEALNNVAKHAAANGAEVRVMLGERRVEMCISDDGRGFDPARITGDHLGLGIMRERADGASAQVDITSAPGQGTRVTVVWDDPNEKGGQAG